MKGVEYMDDLNIIELFWQRDETAIKETDIKYRGYLMSVSYNILNDHQDSDECINDTYLSAWNIIPPQKPNILKTFLGCIIRNISLDCYRKKHAKKRIEFTILLSEIEDFIPSDISVENEIHENEIAGQISNFIKMLSIEKQQIFVRRYWHCDSVKSLSEKYRYSESKIKSMLYEIRKKLKVYLEKEGVL